MSTAGPAWQDTAQTHEAPVLLEGGGLVNLPRADNPLLFTDPVSLSYGDLNVSHGSRTDAQLVRLVDAGGGDGTWELELVSQSASAKKATPTSFEKPWPRAHSFSMKMTPASPAMAATFITPTATSTTMRPQQQPTQYAP